ncbi:hypothetical protein Hdeb2414_s0017g00509171 [Helianthus debilis subsp. tardiflorus]
MRTWAALPLNILDPFHKVKIVKSERLGGCIMKLVTRLLTRQAFSCLIH